MSGLKQIRPKAGHLALAIVLAGAPLLGACSDRDAATLERTAAAQAAATRAEQAAVRAEKAAAKAGGGQPQVVEPEPEPEPENDPNEASQADMTQPQDPDSEKG